MSDSTPPTTTVANIGVAMFAVADQDAALEFYTQKLGYEVRSDTRFGENGEMRWLEVAHRGSTARLALNPPMSGEAGGGATPRIMGGGWRAWRRGGGPPRGVGAAGGGGGAGVRRSCTCHLRQNRR